MRVCGSVVAQFTLEIKKNTYSQQVEEFFLTSRVKLSVHYHYRQKFPFEIQSLDITITNTYVEELPVTSSVSWGAMSLR